MRWWKRLLATVKWTATVLSLSFGLIWFASGWISVDYSSAKPSFVIANGFTRIVWFAKYARHPAKIDVGVNPPEFAAVWHSRFWFIHGKDGFTLDLPLWWPAVAMLIPAAFLWYPNLRRVIRRRSGRCITCGYDRRGLSVDATCPECGSKP